VQDGRGRGIRTHDIQLPKLALYQAELYPEAGTFVRAIAAKGRTFWSAFIDVSIAMRSKCALLKPTG
jgi:hypothetical protein